KYGIKYQPAVICPDIACAKSAASRFGYPVALKISSKKFTHKSDVGGVALGIRGDAELEKAYDSVIGRVGRGNVDGVLVQKMSQQGFELIIGGMKDSQFGHLVMVGLGGIYVEVMKDFAFRICPVSKPDAVEMIHSLKSYKIISGARGKKPIDEGALAEMIVRTSKMIVSEDLSELYFNPVIANERGCTVIDWRFSKPGERQDETISAGAAGSAISKQNGGN
ncbi:MAG TPA: acetate--CoA ligase family protein, partial [Candidatus Micrarchaeota archaeon]|nr:acetate--CoA ligase family protein [Candidatus Micrarchaeota archaeon]